MTHDGLYELAKEWAMARALFCDKYSLKDPENSRKMLNRCSDAENALSIFVMSTLNADEIKNLYD